jgi:flagellar hook protein FlgE
MSIAGALYTGLSGLDTNQTEMNVVGNNIANANTTAFKSSTVQFTPESYVTAQAGTAPTNDFGGENPEQYGLGAQVGAINTDFSEGSIQATGTDTDMAISGDGFFVLNTTQGQQFTRDGSFTLNSSNQLVTSTGGFVQGYQADPQGDIIAGSLGNLTIPLGESTSSAATQNVEFAGNLNGGGAVAAGASILATQDITTVGGGTAPTSTTLLSNVASTSSPTTPLMSVGEVFTLNGQQDNRSLPSATFTVTTTSTVGDLMNFYQQGLGIDTSFSSDVPPPGVTLQADPANPGSSQIVVTGNTGNDNALELGNAAFVSSSGQSPFTFSPGTNSDGATNNPSGESVHTSFTVYDSLGSPVTVGVNAVLESQSTSGTTWRYYVDSPNSTNGNPIVGNGTITFGSSGQYVSSTGGPISIDRTGTGAATPLTFALNFSSMSALASTTSTMEETSQDGSPIGTLESFSVGANGIISGAYSNGLTKTLGQVSLATFSNEQGLNNEGGGVYQASPDSGAAVIGAPQAGSAGSVQSGALELSNVNISQEFVNLIIASTGYSASSRVISTADQLIQELLNTSQG